MPVRLDETERDVGDETLFEFPFNREDCLPPKAFEEIREKLLAPEYPLLFLSNLQEVKFRIAGSVGGTCKKEVQSARTFGETNS